MPGEGPESPCPACSCCSGSSFLTTYHRKILLFFQNQCWKQDFLPSLISLALSPPHTHAYMHSHAHTRTHHTNTRTHMHSYAHMQSHTLTHAGVHVHVRTYTHTHTLFSPISSVSPRLTTLFAPPRFPQRFGSSSPAPSPGLPGDNHSASLVAFFFRIPLLSVTGVPPACLPCNLGTAAPRPSWVLSL